MDTWATPRHGVTMPFVLQHVIELRLAPTTGALSVVLPALRRRLSILGQDAEVLRVGVTGDPIRRAREHRGYGFEWFEVLWDTSSAERAGDAEAALYQHALVKGLLLAGRRSGGIRGEGPFVVYAAGR